MCVTIYMKIYHILLKHQANLSNHSNFFVLCTCLSPHPVELSCLPGWTSFSCREELSAITWAAESLGNAHCCSLANVLLTKTVFFQWSSRREKWEVLNDNKVDDMVKKACFYLYFLTLYLMMDNIEFYYG